MAQPDHKTLKHIQTTAQSGESVINSDEYDLESLYAHIGESSEYQGRYRSLEIVLINGTNCNLKFDSEYFYAGHWFVSPNKLVIQPGSAMVALAANKAGLASGCDGGMRWIIEGNRQQSRKYLIIGFENPIGGSYKTFIQCTSDHDVTAESGYDNAHNDDTKFETQEGFLLLARVDLAKRGGDKLMEFVISKEAN